MSDIQTAHHPKWQKVLGLILSVVPSLMLLGSAAMKFKGGDEMAKGFDHLGLPLELATGLGTIEGLIALVNLIPKVSFLGAILITGYMGGAILTHLRIGEPVFVQFLFGVVVWVGYGLRNPDVIRRAFKLI